MFTLRVFNSISLKAATLFLILASSAGMAMASNVIIRTSMGDIPIQLYDTVIPPMTPAPQTVANFLNYVNSGAYNNSFIQRDVPGFIIQAGGYVLNGNGVAQIKTNPPVVNEFSPTRSNVAGTIAMALVSGNPNSATSQWFINLVDNSANLDNQNGGFTVFGQVTGNGMNVANAIAALPTVNAGGDFSNLPLATPLSGNTLQASNFVTYSIISQSQSQSQWDCLFNWAEQNYPSLFPGHSASQVFNPYYYRYYPGTNSYVGVSIADANVYYLNAAGILQSVGPVTTWLATSGCK